MTEMAPTKFWYTDMCELLSFAEYLVDSGEFDRGGVESQEALHDLLYFFEKPWKWNQEHALWTNTKSGACGAYAKYLANSK